jgi:CheY-like chemotaxis protein
MDTSTEHRKSRRFQHKAAVRVLIFEDNDILRPTLKHILEKLGYEVFTFSDPGLCPVSNSANHNCPLDHACADIIISDVNMPAQTGLELMKDRKQRGCKTKYRALMSGDWTDSNLKYAKELGCRVFHKPFNLNEMTQWLDDCNERIEPERRLSNLPAKKI